ncbi:30S ribosomal protein S7 [Candidatus Micrarchaeota archaeon]|nr:30S ribosomal protein S7 [Candidatus Micrarchaeota archaeon]
MDSKLFGKYSYDGIQISDPSIAQVISLKPVTIPHTYARHANKQFAKQRVNVVERLVNKLMRGGTGEKLGGKIIRTHGKLQGKKSKAIKIVKKAFEIVEKQAGQSPLQLLVKAVENSAPREGVTRVRLGGIAYQVAVDEAAQRRLDVALRNIALAAITQAFKNKLSLAEALANEIILASKNSQDSYSVKRKNEAERMAKSAR